MKALTLRAYVWGLEHRLCSIVNNNSAEDYRCENIVANNVSLAPPDTQGKRQEMICGAASFSSEGGRRVAVSNTRRCACLD